MDIVVDSEFLKWKEYVKFLMRFRNGNTSSDIGGELERLISMIISGICGPRDRFPGDGIYINVSFGLHADVISAMAEFDINDPKLKRKIQNALHAALAYRESSLDVYDRAKFERHFNLRWVDGTRWRRLICIIIHLIIIIIIIAIGIEEC